MTWLKIRLLAVGFVLGFSACQSQTATWTTVEEMPTPRFGTSASEIGKTIYVIGGSQDNQMALSTVEMYDSATNSWSMAEDMPTGRYFHGASVVDGRIIIIGGAEGPRNASSKVEIYDPDANT